MHIAAATAALTRRPAPALRELRGRARREARSRCETIVKIGRTHLQDATPLTLGQEFAGTSPRLDDAIARDRGSRPARGTSSRSAAPRSAPGSTPIRSSRTASAARIAELTGLPFVDRPEQVRRARRPRRARPRLRRPARPRGRPDQDRQRRPLARLRAALRPRRDLRLPANEPGSSIMPGKVNPTQCEALTMVCAQVIGNDAAIGFAGIAGQLRAERLQAGHRAQRARSRSGSWRTRCRSFREHCVDGLEADEERIASTSASVAHAGHRAQPAHRLRQGGRRSRRRPTTRARRCARRPSRSDMSLATTSMRGCDPRR